MIKKFAPQLWFLARIFIGLVMAYAGLGKLLQPIEELRAAIAHYEIIPYPLIPLVAYPLPWLELFTGVFLILGYAPRFAAAIAAALCLCFLMTLGSSDQLLDMSVKDCGCFAASGPIHLSPRQVFILDFINLIMAVQLARMKTHFLSLDSLLKSSKPNA